MTTQKHDPASGTSAALLTWLRIVLSMSFISYLIGYIVFTSWHSIFAKIGGVLIILSGTTLGIVWATKSWKKIDRAEYESKEYGSPDLDRVAEQAERDNPVKRDYI